MNMKPRHLFFAALALLTCHVGQAKETSVDVNTLSAAFDQAADQDILLLESGTYSGRLTFPNGKTLTLKAAPGADVVFAGTFTGNESDSDGGIILDGLDIVTGENYFIDMAYGNVKTIAVRNCSISDIGRCFLRTNNAGKVIDAIEFTNCIVSDCGTNGYCFLYPQHGVKSVSVKNCTLKNYTSGESFFGPKNTTADIALTFVFENNTVYKWSKSSSYALCKADGKYSNESTYTFRNNIISTAGVAGQKPLIVAAKGGNLIAQNNLVDNYGGYSVSNAASSTIEDLTLEALGIDQIFPDPENGDFSIVSTSPLATASTEGGVVGDPRWLKTFAQAVTLTTSSLPQEGGTTTPLSGNYEKGSTVTLSASHNYGYRFEAWKDEVGNTLSTENPYTFTIENDTRITATFTQQTLYTLHIEKEGEGAPWGEYLISPQKEDNRYESGEEVTVTVVPNPVTTFLYWGDGTSEDKQTVVMDQEQKLILHYDVVPFIVGWDFDTNKNPARNERQGDYYFKSDNTGVMYFYNGDGSSTNWGGSERNFGGKNLSCARRYTDYDQMGNPRYFIAKFSAAGYENIKIHSYVAADNNCVHRGQKMQFSTDGIHFTDLASLTLTGISSEWTAFDAMLPDTLSDDAKKSIYIRWIGDATTELLGPSSAGDTEGFYLADVFVYADEIHVDDFTAPQLLSSTPAHGSNNASANGNIVLTFDEKVQAGTGEVTLNGEVLTPVFGSKTASYAYSGLTYGTTYEVIVPDGAITDLSGNRFPGVTLQFTTMERPRPTAKTFDAVVAADGTGDYTTVQAAIDAAPENRSKPYLIFVKNGIYDGLVRIPENKPFIHLIGQDRDRTIIQYKINCAAAGDAGWDFSANNAAYYPAKDDGTVVKVSSSDFYSENISYINTWGYEQQNGPMALAMYTRNDRHAFYRCNFRSFQDTWQTSTNQVSDRLYAKDCYVEGAVDYIYGGGDCLFETCELYNLRSTGSVIVAPAHKEGTRYGYVFESCTIDGVVDNKDALGRPWHNSPIAVYLNTTMKRLPSATGWNNMGTIPALFAEYNSMDADGNPIDLSNRRTQYSYTENGETVTGSCRATITAEEAARMNYDNIIPGTDNWNPRQFFEPIVAPENVRKDKDILSWEACDYAICYLVLQNDSVVDITTQCQSVVDASTESNLFAVKAVNEYGSLGPAGFAQESTSGNNSLAADNQRPDMVAMGGNGHIELLVQAPLAVTIHNAAGLLVKEGRFTPGVHFVAPLPAGFYLVNGQKVIVR